MSDTNQVTVRGRVGTEPDVLVTVTGKEMTKFRLGSTRSYRDASGEWHDTQTEWFTVKAWGPAGQLVRQSLHRGMPVIVQGVLSSDEWVSEERTHHTNVITAHTIGVDIAYGLVTFSRITRQASGDGATPASPDEAQEAPDDHLAGEDAAELPEEHSPLGEEAWVRAPVDA